jgi:hypothetical protein
MVISSHFATGRRLFTAAGFRYAMAHPSSAASKKSSRNAASVELVPETLDEHPDRAAAWVTGIYALALHRKPDTAGFRMHAQAIREGATPTSVLDGIMASPEASSRSSSQHPDLLEAFVTGAYLVALGRLPDPDGLRTYITALHAGMSDVDLLAALLASEEAQQQLRFPPAPADHIDVLAEQLQTVALRSHVTAEQTAWAREALRNGVAPRQVVRSLARRLRGVTPAGVYAAATARSRAAAAANAALVVSVHAEVLRERRWQWDLQRATWERLDRLEALVQREDKALPDGPDGRTPPR